jgi:hypothetical protein
LDNLVDQRDLTSAIIIILSEIVSAYANSMLINVAEPVWWPDGKQQLSGPVAESAIYEEEEEEEG